MENDININGKEDISKVSNEELLDKMILWIRIGRNEGKLKGEERTYFRSICEEINKRNLLNYKPSELRDI